MAPTDLSPMHDNRVFRLRQGRSLWIGGIVLVVIIALGSMVLHTAPGQGPANTEPAARQPAAPPATSMRNTSPNQAPAQP
jgi:hypothetical protein